MQHLIVALPFCNRDAQDAIRLLKWIKELDGTLANHCLLLVADDAVPGDTKQQVKAVAKEAFVNVETMTVKAPAPVNANYHVPAAVMFEQAARQIDQCYKWNWIWLEPDAVPLVPYWLDVLADHYTLCPKRFMGVVHHHDQKDVKSPVFYGTAVYPNCAHPDLKKFCDGKQAFDMAWSDYVVPRAENTNLIFHRFGTPSEAPTFKAVTLPTDGPNVGTLDILPKEAVLFHRNKDGTLIELLRERNRPVPSHELEPSLSIDKRTKAYRDSVKQQQPA